MSEKWIRIDWANLPKMEFVGEYGVDAQDIIIPDFPQYIVKKRESVMKIPNEPETYEVFITKIHPTICDNACIVLPILYNFFISTDGKINLGRVHPDNSGVKRGIVQANITEDTVQVCSNNPECIAAIWLLLTRESDDSV